MGVQQCCAADAILAADYMESCGIVRRRRPFARLWECDCKAEGIAVLVDSAYDEEGVFWIGDACLPVDYGMFLFYRYMCTFIFILTHHPHPTPLGTITTRGAFCQGVHTSSRLISDWPVAVTHSTVIQHHHDKHLSLHQIAYLRSALIPSRKKTSSRQFIPFRRLRIWATCSFESIIALVTLLLIHRVLSTISGHAASRLHRAVFRGPLDEGNAGRATTVLASHVRARTTSG